MNGALDVDDVLERLRRLVRTHWTEVTLDPLIDLWSLAPALLARLSALRPHAPSEVSMPTKDSEIEQWIADADGHASFQRESSEEWRDLARRWHAIAETAAVDKEAKRRTGAAAAIVAEGRLRSAMASEETARGLRALLAETDSAAAG